MSLSFEVNTISALPQETTFKLFAYFSIPLKFLSSIQIFTLFLCTKEWAIEESIWASSFFTFELKRDDTTVSESKNIFKTHTPYQTKPSCQIQGYYLEWLLDHLEDLSCNSLFL